MGDVSEANLERAAESLRFSGYDVHTMLVNALNKDEVYAFAAHAAELGDVTWFVDTAGASPSQAKPQFIIDLDLTLIPTMRVEQRWRHAEMGGRRAWSMLN